MASKITDSKLKKVKSLIDKGNSYKSISKVVNLSPSTISNLITGKIKNSFFPISTIDGGVSRDPSQSWGTNDKKNLNSYVAPITFARLVLDVRYWRESIKETEMAYFPQRVKMQRVHNDTWLDPQVWAAVMKRKELTLLKNFGIYDLKGNEVEELTNLFKNKEWFNAYRSYHLDAEYFGYTLIGLGDIVNNEFPDIISVRRHLVSPERLNLAPFEYMLEGMNFMEDPNKDWCSYIPTKSDIGITKCGYGLLYYCAPFAISNRNVLKYNNDFVEKYSMPTFVWKTIKSDDERDNAEAAAQKLGNDSYLIIDPQDDVDFLESKLGGTGYLGYDNLEKRNEQKIAKLILGHEDAMAGTKGAMGSHSSTASKGKTEAEKAVDKKAANDANTQEIHINNILFPKLMRLGFEIPAGYTFKYKTDEEEQDQQHYENAENAVVSQTILNLKQAGINVDPKEVGELMGLTLTEAPPESAQSEPDFTPEDRAQVIKNSAALEKLYSRAKR